MERRAYFIFGDLLACIVAGAASAWLTQLAVPGHWYALVGMIIGIAIGMPVGMVTGFLFSPLFGAFEVMLPASLAGMVAGMVVGMGHILGAGSPADAVFSGAALGVFTMVFCYMLQARLQGEVS